MPRTQTSSRFTQRLSIGVAAVTLLGAVGIGGYNLASAAVEEGTKPVFVPINPCRLIDTRPGADIGTRDVPLQPRETLTVRAHGSNGDCTGASAIPPSAVGLSMNVVAIRPTQGTFLTIWGEGPLPTASNLNPDAGDPPTPNAVNTPLSSTGSFNIYNNAGTVAVAIDVNGYYADHNHDDRYLTEAESTAEFGALDTRIDAIDAQADAIAAQAAAIDARLDGLSGIPFLAGGIVTDTSADPDPAAGPVPTVIFNGPSGTSESVSREEIGVYTVTVNGLAEAVTGTVQITALADTSPGVSSGAAVCATIGEPSSSATTFTFEVGCFGESDAVDDEVIAENASFQFLIVG